MAVGVGVILSIGVVVGSMTATLVRVISALLLIPPQVSKKVISILGLDYHKRLLILI